MGPVISLLTTLALIWILIGAIGCSVENKKEKNKKKKEEKERTVAEKRFYDRKESELRAAYKQWEDQFKPIKDNSIENYRRLATFQSNISAPSKKLKEEYLENIKNLKYAFLMEYAPSKEEMITKKVEAKSLTDTNFESKYWVKDAVSKMYEGYTYEDILNGKKNEALDIFLEKGCLCRYFSDYQANMYRMDAIISVIESEFNAAVMRELAENPYFITYNFKYIDQLFDELYKKNIINKDKISQIKYNVFLNSIPIKENNVKEKLGNKYAVYIMDKGHIIEDGYDRRLPNHITSLLNDSRVKHDFSIGYTGMCLVPHDEDKTLPIHLFTKENMLMHRYAVRSQESLERLIELEDERKSILGGR